MIPTSPSLDLDTLAETLGWPEEITRVVASLPEEHQAASLLVWLAHRGADRKLRRKYAVKWWSGYLPERVMLSAMISDDLAAFTAELSSRLGGTIGEQGASGELHRYVWRTLLTLPESLQRRALDALEGQASVFATIVRGAQDLLREEEHGESDSEEIGEAFGRGAPGETAEVE